MSLINDALKRAKQAQPPPSGPVAPPPQLRPAEPPQVARAGAALGLSIGLTALALLALLCVWVLSRGGETKLVAAKEQTPNVETAAPAPVASEPAVAAPEPVSSPASPEETSPQAPAAEPVVAPPPPLRLQAIIFNPKRPSATIGRRTDFVGDKCAGFRVVAINQTSATLVGGRQTNVLNLSE
jgi:hypothetical protein